ncbi:hypothetical protein JCM10914A_45880 [Paenibacillus sp. JCM 10914]|uniref:GNAT family N-acetyltransferase n=1 Tax=Paenibacillus sp. JCM 10914 TaxID=1236974 RepID=UPI0003CC3F91|nr:GNAT family N-acetyltransferase [Paenibacillus sp. JCM 10914]GAE08734.1 GCN5-related N-acetyltransferase [Paenibacillus sp. JCM 10914]
MTKLQVEIVDYLNEEQKDEVATLYYQAFPLKLQSLWMFAGSESEAVTVLRRSLRYENGLYAVMGGKVLGFIGLEKGDGFFASLHYKTLKSSFGVIGGMWRYTAYGIYRLFHGNIPKDAVHIDPVVVSSNARGLGIGTRLFEAAFIWARQANRSKMVLEVVDTNPQAKKLYERLGFEVFKEEHTGLFTEKSGFKKVIHMEKSLNSLNHSK